MTCGDKRRFCLARLKFLGADRSGTWFAPRTAESLAPRPAAFGGMMGLVRLLGFTTLACGCVVGRYREVATSREVAYVEEKGSFCAAHGHRRNHTVTAERIPVPTTALPVSRTA